MSKQFTANEVKEAGSVEKGLHIIIDNNVYEMGSFVDEHPGGAKILKRVGGKDASKQFWKVSGARILRGLLWLWTCYRELRSMAVRLVSTDLKDRGTSIPARGGFATRLQMRLPVDCGVILERTRLTNTLLQYHNESVLKKYQDRLKVGTLKESAKL